MLSGIAKTALTATALAPVALCYAWVAATGGQYSTAYYIIMACLILFFLCNYILGKAKDYVPDEELKIVSAECADGEAIAMLLMYLLPLFTSKFGDLYWGVWVPAMVLIALIVGTGNCFNFNPLLRLQGWHFFKVGTPEGVTYLLLTKKKIKNTTGKITIIPLTEYIMMDTEEKK